MIKIIIALLLALPLLHAQQCTSLNHQRCICSSSTPYCSCAVITTTNSINSSLNYYSHLVLVSGQGCRPCPSSCLTCSSLTVCTICQSSFQLVNGTCIPCPINCQTCSNGVCSLCNNGYYLDYYTVCQSCPISGTNVCTINSLISCLSNYWLDNNAANCIQCDINCQQCSSTTKCSICKAGYYLLSNFSCGACASYCKTCSDSISCLICLNASMYYNSTSLQCQSSSLANCYIPLNSTSCQQCDSTSYLTSANQCTSIVTSSISNCQQHALYLNGSIYCRNCTIGYFNSTGTCSYGCSIMCNSCYGPHYGLCYSCVANSFFTNFHCIASYNINSGSAYQLFYTAFNNPSFFTNGSTLLPTGCIPETIYGETSQLSFTINNPQSYMLTIKWKVYIYNTSSTSTSSNYSVTFSNTKISKSYSYTASMSLSTCASMAIVDKNALSVSGVVHSSNRLTFTVNSAKIGISQVLVIGYRCGGIQGTACQECSSTSTCTKCVNSNYYISGYTCVQACPSSSFIRITTRSCEQTCPSGTYIDYVHQYCRECVSPCATCVSNTSCLSCIDSYYLYNNTCLSACPSGYYAYDLTNTCEACLRPCHTCLSNLKCLSCIYGFYLNTTNSCVFNCQTGFYGDLTTLTCLPCISPCLTCNRYIGTQCQSCIAGYYYYNSRCLTVCQSGFYSTQNSTKCLACDPICNTCQSSSTFCLSCRLGTSLMNNTCVTQCPTMYYSQSVSKSCQSCPTYCLTCLNLNYCQSCINGSYFYAQNYSCLPTCPDYFYSNAGKCSRCQLPCLQCISQTACITCSGLFVYNYTCMSRCPASTYGDTSTMKCQQCNQTLCLQCYITSTSCTKCQSNKILFSSQCLDSCPLGYYNTTNNICSRCDVKCLSCTSATYCLSCTSNYVLQNGTCSKNCNNGYYFSMINSTNSCQPCPTGCSTCQYLNSNLTCLTCLNKYFLINGQCTLSCPTQYYSSNSQCYKCPLPCQTCQSQSQCTGCAVGYGAFFNGSCLTQCPLGYFTNTSTNTCNLCSTQCLKCEVTADNCTSCNSSLYFQLNTCLTACSSGYYAPTNSNTCKTCNSLCLTCSLRPSNCTSCTSSYIFYKNLCIQFCPSGTYLNNKNCIACQVGCSSCINATYCNQCTISYFLNSTNQCVSTCTSDYFGYNGLCRKCSYPCSTCNSSSICLSCSAGYYYNGNCIWTCPSSTYLNLTLSTCDSCPINCSSCTNSSYCLQCSNGVLVSGKCQQNCPLGFFNYYSVCAPCMYGCLICSSSNTCSQCYIGFLYQNLCVEMCPTGLVALTTNTSTYCQKCITGCLKCTVLPSQCISCASGLFLYIFSCLQDCPAGTYKDYSSSTCVSCTNPCSTCKNGYSCLTCIYGYILYSQPNGDQCIQGPTCPNSYFLNLQTNTCVYSCPTNLYKQYTKGTCSKPCPSTYVLLSQNLTCLSYCPSNMWIDESYTCQNATTMPSILPNFTCSPLILRNLLVFDCLFNTPISNLGSLTTQNFSISNVAISNIIIFNQNRVRLITTLREGVVRSEFITVSLTYRYQLLSTSTSQGRRLQNSGSLPVQNTNHTVFINEYFSYSKDQRRTGMQLMQISQSVCIGAIIFWFFALIKNLNSTSLTFILMLQWLHCFSLVDTSFPSNLGQFLQGFRYANLFWSTGAFSGSYLWKITNSYREVLWGISNYFQFTTAIFSSLCIILFFVFIFLVSYFLFWKFRERTEQEKQDEQGNAQQGSEKKQEKSIISNIPSQKDQQQENKSAEHNESKNSFQQSKYSLHKSQQRSKSHFSTKKQQRQIKKSTQSEHQQQQQIQRKKREDQEWRNTKLKIATKSKIINDRYYYNYCLHCILITASPISIASYCQIIAPNPLSLSFSLFFWLFYMVIIIKFAMYAYSQQKIYVSTKYWFIMFIQTLIFNGLAVLSTAQIFIGVSILILIINLYVWRRIFNTKKSNPLKTFHQINELIRIIILIEGLIGYTNKKKWSSDTYYNYSWVFIGTLIILIVVVAIQSTKQFIDQDQGIKTVVQTQAQLDDKQTNSQTSSKVTSKKYSSKNVSEGENDQKREQQQFFSEEEPVSETQSDSDIIDFDQNTSINHERAPKELIKYEKRATLQQ